MPGSRIRAAHVGAVVDALLSTMVATESVVGVFFSRALLDGPLGHLPGSPSGVPVIIIGSSLGLMLLAVVNSDLGRDLKVVTRKVHGRTLYFVSGPGLHGLILVFGSGLGTVLVVGDRGGIPSELLIPGRGRSTVFPAELPIELIAPLLAVARGAESAVLARAMERSGAMDTMADASSSTPSGAPRPNPPFVPSAPDAPLVPVPSAPSSPSSSSVNGSPDGGRPPVSAVLAWRTPLEALMYAGLVRLRQWAPTARAALVLDSPG